MPAEIDLYGLYVPRLLVLAVASLFILMLVRRIMSWTGLYKAVWHRGLFDLALYVILLNVLTLTARWPAL